MYLPLEIDVKRTYHKTKKKKAKCHVREPTIENVSSQGLQETITLLAIFTTKAIQDEIYSIRGDSVFGVNKKNQ